MAIAERSTDNEPAIVSSWDRYLRQIRPRSIDQTLEIVAALTVAYFPSYRYTPPFATGEDGGAPRRFAAGN